MSLRRRTESTTDILDDNDANIWTNRKKKAKTFIFFTLKLDGILLVVLVCLLIVKNRLLEQDRNLNSDSNVGYNTATSDNGVCIPCDYLGPEVKAEDTLFDTIQNHGGGKICCHKDKSHFQNMIARMMDPMITKPFPETDNEVYDKMKWWRKRTSAFHVYLSMDSMFLDMAKLHKTDGNLVLKWTAVNDHLGTAFVSGVNFINGTTVTVIDSGVYFIYSAVTFDFGDVTSVKTHTHDIKQFHPLAPTTKRPPLLINRFGGSSETKRLYTSFLCGSFKLDSGLQISSTVSESVALIHFKKSKYTSYFGMFKI